MIRRLLLTNCFLLLLLFLTPACQGPGSGDGQLTVVFPTETTELTGGQSLRVTLSLQDSAGQPVEGATAQAELRHPNGDTFATLPCADRGQGHYLADTVRLPLRSTGGTWRVIAQATWGDGEHARAERDFKGLPSVNERLYTQYGFWIDPPHIFEYNEIHPSDPHFEEGRYDDGGGYVLLENNLPQGVHTTIAEVAVHWRKASLPADQAAAIAHVRSLAVTCRGDSSPPSMDLTAEPTTFQERPMSTPTGACAGHCVWRVTGQWQGSPVGKAPPPGGPIEWLIFDCPGSDWLWTLAISTNDAEYMDELRVLRETFECPAPR